VKTSVLDSEPSLTGECGDQPQVRFGRNMRLSIKRGERAVAHPARRERRRHNGAKSSRDSLVEFADDAEGSGVRGADKCEIEMENPSGYVDRQTRLAVLAAAAEFLSQLSRTNTDV
jgi:hypothetical protein